ncbi:MAG: ribonuclease toxin HepT-like protein [Desulfocucumaceae bacterium]
MTPNLILLEVRLRKEIENLEKLVEELKTITKTRDLKVNSIRIRACASILHDFYSGIEKMFINIARETDRTVPREEGWHRELLEQMTLEHTG